MKYLKNINEAGVPLIVSKIMSELNSSLEEIKNVFIDFEDSNIIKYEFPLSGSSHTSDGMIRNVSFIIPASSRYIDNKEVVLTCNIKLNYVGNTDSTRLAGASLDGLEDVIVCMKRLESMGYHCSVDLNSNHHLYKPCVVYITIKLDA